MQQIELVISMSVLYTQLLHSITAQLISLAVAFKIQPQTLQTLNKTTTTKYKLYFIVFYTTAAADNTCSCILYVWHNFAQSFTTHDHTLGIKSTQLNMWGTMHDFHMKIALFSILLPFTTNARLQLTRIIIISMGTNG